MSATLADLLDPAVQRDPHAWFRLLQDEAPVYRSPQWGWLVSRHADVMSALQEPALTATGAVDALFAGLPPALQQTLTPLREHLVLWLGNRVPSEHATVRSLFAPAFHPQSVARLRPMVTSLAARLLDGVTPGREFDIVSEFAQPLPAQTIAQLLGADARDSDRFQRWSRCLTEFLGFGMLDPDVLLRAQAAVVEMTDYLDGCLADRSPDDEREDLMTTGARSIADGQIARDDFLSNCVLLLFAGHETTAIAIANTLLLLMQHPDVRAGLRDDPSLGRAIVHESLRYASPVQMIRRTAEADVVVGGTLIQRGEFVWLILGAANRDPREFPNPDVFHPARRQGRNVAFGFGRHFCLGAALSLVEAEAAIQVFLEKVPQPTLRHDRVDWLPNPATRALRQLVVLT